MQTEVIADPAAARALRTEWDDLLGRAALPSVFLTPEWLLSWWEAFGDGLQMHLITIRDGGRLAGLFPLARNGSVLQGWANDYTDRFGPIVDGGSQEAVEAAARHLASEPDWSRLDLLPLSGDSPVTRWISSGLAAVGAGNRLVPWFESPIIDLPDDPDLLRAGLGGSFRSTLRRKGRKAEAAGYRSEVRTDSAALDEAFDVSADTWAHREGTGIGSTPQNRAFYTALARVAAERDWLRIGLLREDGGRPVAFELNLRYGAGAVNLKLGYRDEAREASPGLVLRQHVIEALIEEGAADFDLLGSAEPYKLHWTSRTVQHFRLRAYPPTVLGRASHLYRHRARPIVGRMARAATRIGRRRG